MGLEDMGSAFALNNEVVLDHNMIWGPPKSGEGERILKVSEAQYIASLIRNAQSRDDGLKIVIRGIQVENDECLKMIVEAAKDNKKVVSIGMDGYARDSELSYSEMKLMADFTRSKSSVGDGKRSYIGLEEEYVEDFAKENVGTLCDQFRNPNGKTRVRTVRIKEDEMGGTEKLEDKDVDQIVEAIGNSKGLLSIVIDTAVLNDNQLEKIVEAASKQSNINSMELENSESKNSVSDKTVSVMARFAMTKYQKPDGTEISKSYAGSRKGDVDNMKILHTAMNSLSKDELKRFQIGDKNSNSEFLNFNKKPSSKYNAADLFAKTIDGKNAFDVLLERTDIEPKDKSAVIINILSKYPEANEAFQKAGKGNIKEEKKIILEIAENILGVDKAITQLESQNPMQTLTISGLKFDQEQGKRFVEALSKRRDLKSIKLDNVTFEGNNEKLFQDLFEGLKKNKNLRNLDLGNQEVDAKLIKELRGANKKLEIISSGEKAEEVASKTPEKKGLIKFLTSLFKPKPKVELPSSPAVEDLAAKLAEFNSKEENRGVDNKGLAANVHPQVNKVRKEAQELMEEYDRQVHGKGEGKLTRRQVDIGAVTSEEKLGSAKSPKLPRKNRISQLGQGGKGDDGGKGGGRTH